MATNEAYSIGNDKTSNNNDHRITVQLGRFQGTRLNSPPVSGDSVQLLMSAVAMLDMSLNKHAIQ